MEEAAQVEVYGKLELLDGLVIAAYILLSIGLGVMFAKRGQKDTEAYYVGGRGMPWWLIGISICAACFAADTPLWIGEIVYKRGLEGTWNFWCTAIGFSFYVFVIAPLWRRSHIITDLEFLELRYSGNAAKWLRAFNSVYFSLFFSVVMMGVSTLSITTIMQATTGLPKEICVVIVMFGALIYCSISGLWGIASADFMQFFVAFIGSAILAGFSLFAVGGPEKLVEFLHNDTAWPGRQLNIMPGFGAAGGLPLLTVFYIFFMRWFDNASIGAYVSQKLFAARSTKQATYAAMLHSLLYWSIVPFPWIITILAARMYMPDMEVGKEAYPRMAMAVLPVGLKGVLVASLLAAFMSTYAALLSWGSSYAINDFYRRFLVKNKGPKHYVRVGQLYMLPMAIISAYIAYKAESIFNLLTYLFMVPSAIYTVFLVRWLWWRVNAWAEIAALLSGVFFVVLIYLFRKEWLLPENVEACMGKTFITIIVGSLIVWLIVMFLTPAVDKEKLDAFVKRVNPPGFWGPVRRRVGMQSPIGLGGILYGWFLMLMAIFGPLIGLIKLFFGEPILGACALAIGILGIVLAVRRAQSMNEDGIIGQVGNDPVKEEVFDGEG